MVEKVCDTEFGDLETSRRRLLTRTCSIALAAGAGPTIRPGRASAQPRTLRIMQWRHFVPGYDEWFNGTFANEWGETNDTRVIVDNVGFGEIATRTAAQIQARRGHDLIQFVTPHATYRDHLLDHQDVFEECARRYGAPAGSTVRANYDPETKAYLGFAAAFQPALVTYRKALWDGARSVPNSWNEVLTGARRIRLLHGKPAGISLAPEHNCEQTLRSIMYSFGASEQDADQNPALRSRATLEALGYMKTLNEQSMTREMLTWDGASNNRFMLSGEGCITVDSLSIVRAGEKMGVPFADDLRLAPMPEGPAARLGSFGHYSYATWKFSDNPDGAKQFLVDLVGRSRDAFLASGFQNMPCYPDAVPDLAAITGGEIKGAGARYALMKDVPGWTTNVGHPGCTGPAVSEIYDKGLVSRMFAAVATGRLTPDAALDEADREGRTIFERWKGGGKL